MLLQNHPKKELEHGLKALNERARRIYGSDEIAQRLRHLFLGDPSLPVEDRDEFLKSGSVIIPGDGTYFILSPVNTDGELSIARRIKARGRSGEEKIWLSINRIRGERVSSHNFDDSWTVKDIPDSEVPQVGGKMLTSLEQPKSSF